MLYGIGLDIGITSVGYSVVALNENEEPQGIIRLGVRIFDAAENPKDGASLALPRREARSSRRRLRRHKHRIERIRNLFLSQNLITETELDSLFAGKLEDIYALRTRALDERITNQELCRILIHLAQRRGFRSNRKSDSADKETGLLLAAVSENERRLLEKNYRTVGEMFHLDPMFQSHKRNKSETYLSTVKRDMISDEARLILNTQRDLGNLKITDELSDQYQSILLSQRSFELGPGENSPYGGAQVEKMIGTCTFEKDEKRAPKASYSFEYFQLLQDVNHIRIIRDGVSRPLSAEQRKQIIALAHKTPSPSYDRIRKEINLDDCDNFNCVYYRSDAVDAEKKQKLDCLRAYHEMRKALDKICKGRISHLTVNQRNIIGYVMTVYKSDDQISAFLAAAGIEKEEIDQLLLLKGFRKFGHLSVKACDKIIPFLEQGMAYNEACENAGYAFRAHEGTLKSVLLPSSTEDMERITSPVARRAISQTIKVVNAIIREQQESPTFINIELARDMSRDFSERKEVEKGIKNNAAANERAMLYIRDELGVRNPSGLDIVKYKLYTEQGGFCVYSQKAFDISRLFEPGYAEIDHIIPYSICFDDSYRNKALVFAEENRHKGNRLPMQYLSGKRQDDFIVWVNTNVRDYAKRQRLLKKEVTLEDEQRYKERNLQDTKTISRFLYNYINDYLNFAPSTHGRKKRVTAVNGSITSYLRKRWGISKVRADGDLHHAADALVVVCTTDGMIQKLSRYAQLRESEYIMDETKSYMFNRATGEIMRELPFPWPDFRRELIARMSSNPALALESLKLPFYSGIDLSTIKLIFVSHMPQHKVSGAAHKDTIKSSAILSDGYALAKRPLTDLKLDSEGELAGYFNPESDRLLYSALRDHLKAYGGDAKKAFSAPFYKPKSDGTPGPIVKKVKLSEKTTLNVSVRDNQGIADHESMIRIDVFHVENDGYYFVPVYVADTLKKELPNRAVVAAKPYSEWRIVEDKDFIFSLYPSDLIHVIHRTGIKLTSLNPGSTLEPNVFFKDTLLYYVSASISTGAISVENHDGSYGMPSLGIKTLQCLEKYQVDVLGNYSKVTRETRQYFK